MVATLLNKPWDSVAYQSTCTYSASASTFATAALHIMKTERNQRSVDHANRQLVGALEDGHSLLGGHSVSDLGTVGVVVHHEELEVLHVVHGELVQAVGEHVLGGSVRAVTDIGHQSGTAEATSAATVNTLGLSPVLLRHNAVNTQKSTFILLNLSAWKRGNDVVLFFTIFTLRTGLMTKTRNEHKSAGVGWGVVWPSPSYLNQRNETLH